MRLPQRVPWASIGELDQLCTWIFADENNLESRSQAIDRIAAWKAITPLPHALESTQTLLTTILQDQEHTSSSSSSRNTTSLRLSYSSALIRLVNGLVDPLQKGAYARSIASIAAQLGLPAWLVELRHAATHEDLPSLELLRDAASQSMSWLLQNYFLPVLNPSTIPHAQTSLRPVSPLLKRYKTLMKLTTRDKSVQDQHRSELLAVERDIERWVSEGKLGADPSVAFVGDDWDGDGDGEEEDWRERWALERLCDALLEKGALVPLSKKKRTFTSTTFLPTKSSLTLWAPLLNTLQSHYPKIPTILVDRIFSYLLSSSPQDEALTDSSFDMSLARWAFWLIDAASVNDEDGEGEFRRDVLITLFTSLGPAAGTARDIKAALALLEALCEGDEDLEAARRTLISSREIVPTSSWKDTDVGVMNSRLATLLDSIVPITLDDDDSDGGRPPPSSTATSPKAMSVQPEIGPGWRSLAGSESWKPSPIGVYVPG